MSTIPDLLDPRRVDQQKKVLSACGHDDLQLSDEAVAELTFLGRHPTDLRRMTLPLLSRTSLEEMYTKRLVVIDYSDSTRWGLTELGTQIADLLGSSRPEPVETDLPGARKRVDQLLDKCAK